LRLAALAAAACAGMRTRAAAAAGIFRVCHSSTPRAEFNAHTTRDSADFGVQRSHNRKQESNHSLVNPSRCTHTHGARSGDASHACLDRCKMRQTKNKRRNYISGLHIYIIS
jgi:hypothetical protein